MVLLRTFAKNISNILIGEDNMAFSLDIPNEVVLAIKLPKKQMEKQLIQEIAFTLYDRELTSMGIARRFAALSKWAFIEGLAERGITRHYYASELEEDINYAKSC
jgi:predicted HTH domain antitoxin